jgi:hypothetical protein
LYFLNWNSNFVLLIKWKSESENTQTRILLFDLFKTNSSEGKQVKASTVNALESKEKKERKKRTKQGQTTKLRKCRNKGNKETCKKIMITRTGNENAGQ